MNDKSKYLGRYVLPVYDVFFHNVYEYTLIMFASNVRIPSVIPQPCLGFESGLECMCPVVIVLESFSNSFIFITWGFPLH